LLYATALHPVIKLIFFALRPAPEMSNDAKRLPFGN
jgi:hypothetical protein